MSSWLLDTSLDFFSWSTTSTFFFCGSTAAAAMFGCGRRARQYTVRPRHLEQHSGPHSLDSPNSSKRQPKTPFVAGGTTPRKSVKQKESSSSTKVGTLVRPQKSDKPAAQCEQTQSDSGHDVKTQNSLLLWTAISPKEPERAPAGKTPVALALRPPTSRRDSLPHEQIFGGAVSMFAVLKRSLPIHAYEPLGILQAACEELRFASRFLDRLHLIRDDEDRLCAVAAFVISGYAALSGRKRKPFNPLLGETFDFISEDGWKYHAEQVSHHPAVSATHAQGPGWQWSQTLEGSPVPAFDGSISATPVWPVTTIIQNARSEADKRVIKNAGEMIIRSSSGCECQLKFKIDGNTVEGKIKNRLGVSSSRLIGQWDRGLNKILASGEQACLFESPPIYELASTYYGFNRFTMGLNELHESQRPFLPPTDSRFRPDQRYLENGDPKRADECKKQLEEQQRGRSSQSYRPLWFAKQNDKFSGQALWISNGRYWEAKEDQFRDTNIVHLFSNSDD